MDNTQQAALRIAFPDSSIGKLPKGGTVLDFVGHAAVTDRLLAVDPEWTWEPCAFDAHGSPALDAEGNLWIRLTVCGVTRLGVGDGASMKIRVGDAIRNAAMRFGVALDLWSRQDLTGNGGGEDDPVSLSPLPDEEGWVADELAALDSATTPADVDEVAARVTDQHPNPSAGAKHTFGVGLRAARLRVASPARG